MILFNITKASFTSVIDNAYVSVLKNVHDLASFPGLSCPWCL